MRAWILEHQKPIEERPMKMIELAPPHPGERQLRVEVTACGICRTDVHLAEGDLPRRKTPVILGHEIVGRVDSVGASVRRFEVGERVGVTWLAEWCGQCRHCRAGRENYCRAFAGTGWDVDGGFAEYAVVREDAAFSLLGVDLPDEQVAPLMCPGVAGHCAFRLTGSGPGDNLGLYGFGPTADYVLKVARHLGLETFVSSRSAKNLERARRQGAAWAGNAAETGMPRPLDAAIVFPAAGPLVEAALAAVEVGGVVVLAPVAMSTIEIEDYSSHFWGRDLRTLYNVNRKDVAEFLQLARAADLSMEVQVFPFEDCQEAMILLKRGELQAPNAVLRIR